MTYHNEMALALSSNGCDYTRITYTVYFLRGYNRVNWHLLDRISSNGCDEANLCITVYFLRGYGRKRAKDRRLASRFRESGWNLYSPGKKDTSRLFLRWMYHELGTGPNLTFGVVREYKIVSAQPYLYL